MGHDVGGGNGEGFDEGLDESMDLTEDDVVILVDDDGGEHRFVLLAIIEVDDSEFAVVAPEEQILDKTREEVDLSFFHVEPNDDGTERFAPITDPEVFSAVERATAELLGLIDAADDE